MEERRQKALEKQIGCKFIRINTSNAKNGYDLDYEVAIVQSFIKKFKKLEKQIIIEKEMREKLEKEMREMREKVEKKFKRQK